MPQQKRPLLTLKSKESEPETAGSAAFADAETAASRALGGGPEELALPPPRNAGSAGNATASVSAMARGLKGPAWQTMPELMTKAKHWDSMSGWLPVCCIGDALCAPLFGSILAVLMPALLAVAATDVLFTMSRGLLRPGGTTGKGFAWHFGEGSCARHAKPSEQQALSKVLTTQSPPAQSSELPAAAADSASRNTAGKNFSYLLVLLSFAEPINSLAQSSGL